MTRALTLSMLLGATASWATPSGKKWDLSVCGACDPGMQCQASHCAAVYRVAASVANAGGTTLNGPQAVPYATAIARIQEAFRNWTSSRVTTCSTTWEIVYGGTFASPSGTTAIGSTGASAGANNVIFLGGAQWRYSSITLGLTTTTFFTSNGQITDADMELNNNVAWADDGRSNSFDYESVVLHEAGHFLGLDHTNVSSAVMTPSVAQGVRKRTLATPDVNDICTVYPGASGSQGATCTAVAQCTGGRVCESAASSTQKICTVDCTGTTATNCPTGYTCQASSAGFACLPQLAVADLCKFCTSGADCSTGICVASQTSLWCSQSCSSSAQCGAGYICDAARSFCVPQSACTNQCTGSSGCPTGFTCTSGTCRPTGTTGSRCEILGVCQSCNQCVSDADDTSVGYCRACCGGASGNGACNGCAATSCGASGTCVGIQSSTDQVCIPSTGATSCQACGGNTPCRSGLLCVNGRCHSSCSVTMPGACQACFDAGGAVGGICACQDEIARLGETCSSSPLKACETGLICVSGSPTSTCRASCTVGNPASCPAGFMCTSIAGQGACTPVPAGSECAACAAGSTCAGNGLTCYSNRCYTSCNITSPDRCSACIQTASNGAGVCVCPDQVVGLGASCSLPNVAFCQAGTACADGVCKAPCNPNDSSSCPAPTRCLPLAGSNYCQTPGANTGGGGGTSGLGGGAGGGLGAGGGGGTLPDDPGCACSTGIDGMAALALLGLARLRRRRAAGLASGSVARV